MKTAAPPRPLSETVATCKLALRTIGHIYGIAPSCITTSRTRVAATARLHYILSLHLHLCLASRTIVPILGSTSEASVRSSLSRASTAYSTHPEFRRKQLDILATLHRHSITP